MKKSRIFLALAGACAIFFAGCSDVGSDSTVSNGFENKTTETKSLTLFATSDDKLLTFPSADDSGASRTILPAAVDASGGDVKFYLSYKDTLAASASEVFETDAVSFSADTGSKTSGKINKTFEISVYDFTLYCVPTTATVTNATTALSNAMFVGYAHADLRYAESITFYLTAANATGKGYVELNLYTSNTRSKTDLWAVPKGYTVTAGIYSLVDDSLVYPTGTPTVLTSPQQLIADTKIDGTPTFGGSSAGVNSGEYNFVVKFTNVAVTPNIVYEYSDRIIVLPNQKTTGDVFIPEVIEKVPNKPTDFIVAYADPKSKVDTDYVAQFAWNDASNNEQSFEIQLIEVSDNLDNTQGTTPSYITSALPTDDDTWGQMLTNYGTGAANVVTYYSNKAPTDTGSGPKVKYQDSDRNPTNKVYSLNKNQETACFYLPLGKRYLARMRAVNEVGPSDWSYLTIGGLTKDNPTAPTKLTHTTTVGSDTTTSEILISNVELTLTMNDFEANVLTINRYSITYNLDGGKFFGDVASGGTGYDTLADKPATVVYETQKITSGAPVGEVILNPDGDSAKSDYIDTTGVARTEVLNLIKGDSKFKRWLLTSTIDNAQEAPAGNRYPVTAPVPPTLGRTVPNAYTGHTNLVLFANYAVDTTMDVTNADYTAFNWATDLTNKKSDVSLIGSDGASTPAPVYFADLTEDGAGNKTLCDNGQYLTISAKTSPTITFKLNETTKQYDEVKLVIRRTNRHTDDDADYSNPWTKPTATYGTSGWSASPAAWDVNVKTWKSGVYEAALIGTSSKYPNKTYTFTITFNLVD